MKLWLLEPIDPYQPPWCNGYDKMYGVVVRAKNEDDARAYASQAAGDEGHAAWLSDLLSTCEPLTSRGSAGVIITDRKDG